MGKMTRTLSLIVLGLIVGVLSVEAAEPKRGGTFILGNESDPSTLTGHLSTDTPTFTIADNIFSSLISLNFDFQPIPDLAERWEVSKDGLAYTFHLNPKARWHDGKPVTAADVEYTFNEILAKVHPRITTWWPNIEYAKAVGEHTFVFKHKAPYAPFFAVLAYTLGSGSLIMPKHIYQNTDSKTNPANWTPIGSGPFKFSKWVKGSYVELVRNENYFKAGKPYLDRLVFQTMPDVAARMLAFENGEIDFLHWYVVAYDRVAKLRKDPRFQIIDKGGEGAATNGYLLFNVRHPILKKEKVRKAIAYAINRDEVQQKALFGEGKVAHSHVNSGLAWAFNGKYDIYRQDYAKANQLLDEAGYTKGSDGTRFKLQLFWSAGREAEGRAAEIMRDHLRQVGIEIQIQTFDRLTFTDRVYIQWDFDMATQLFATGPDPNLGVTSRFHTKQIRKVPYINAMGYSNPVLDKLFDTEYTQTEWKKRVEIWDNIQQIMMNDLPAFPLWEVPVVTAVSAKFKDAITGPFGYIENHENTYMVK